jgi:predicted GIY-YIG superfamily endonuclease
MYTVYVLKSLKNGKRYVGSTAKSPEQRLKEHNEGSNKWTRANRPFELVYQEQLSDKTDCLKREHVLKSGQGRKYLDSAISPK